MIMKIICTYIWHSATNMLRGKLIAGTHIGKEKDLKNKEKQLHPEEVEENNTDKHTWKGPTKSEWFYKKTNETDKPQAK